MWPISSTGSSGFSAQQCVWVAELPDFGLSQVRGDVPLQYPTHPGSIAKSSKSSQVKAAQTDGFVSL